MQFPNYIPEPIKQQANHYLKGNDDWEGWIVCLEKQKEELSIIDGKIAEWKNHSQDPGYAEYQLQKLRTEELEARAHLNSLEGDISCTEVSQFLSPPPIKENVLNWGLL